MNSGYIDLNEKFQEMLNPSASQSYPYTFEYNGAFEYLKSVFESNKFIRFISELKTSVEGETHLKFSTTVDISKEIKSGNEKYILYYQSYGRSISVDVSNTEPDKVTVSTES